MTDWMEVSLSSFVLTTLHKPVVEEPVPSVPPGSPDEHPHTTEDITTRQAEIAEDTPQVRESRYPRLSRQPPGQLKFD